MKILALDLGTHTGYAHNLGGDSDSVTAGTFHLATAREITAWGKERWTRRNDPRVHRFAKFLVSFPTPDVVVFEDVEFSTYTLQTQLWASLRTCVWLALGPNCLLECVPVTTLKKFATGHGGATKECMAKALYRDCPVTKTQPLDDNAIDAIWLFKWAQTHLSRAALGSKNKLNSR